MVHSLPVSRKRCVILSSFSGGPELCLVLMSEQPLPIAGIGRLDFSLVLSRKENIQLSIGFGLELVLEHGNHYTYLDFESNLRAQCLDLFH